MTAQQLLTLCKHANRKISYYLDQMQKHPIASGKRIDAGVRVDQYSDYLYDLLKEAQATLTHSEYMQLCSSIAD
jgi:hypothetical protein